MSTPPSEVSAATRHRQAMEAMIRKVYGFPQLEQPNPNPSKLIPVPRGGRVLTPSPGRYCPVLRTEVVEARRAAYACGVTWSAWFRWYHLRRNYEADPTAFRNGLLRKVERDPPPMMSLGLHAALRRPGMTMQRLADLMDAFDAPLTEIHQIYLREIAAIFEDMRRPLRPRRNKRRALRMVAGEPNS